MVMSDTGGIGKPLFPYSWFVGIYAIPESLSRVKKYIADCLALLFCAKAIAVPHHGLFCLIVCLLRYGVLKEASNLLTDYKPVKDLF